MDRKLILVSCLLLTLAGIVVAQDYSQSQSTDTTQIRPLNPNSLSQVRVVARTITAVNYPNRGGSTKIDFRGTDLMPQATGRAEVDSKTGRTNIDSHFEHLRPARDYGPEFLTYVLWAITPQGRPSNLGEIIPNGDGKSSLKTATDFQSFGMIVTAEPYFAVTRPSDMVILNNVPRPDTKGTEVPIAAKVPLHAALSSLRDVKRPFTRGLALPRGVHVEAKSYRRNTSFPYCLPW